MIVKTEIKNGIKYTYLKRRDDRNRSYKWALYKKEANYSWLKNSLVELLFLTLVLSVTYMIVTTQCEVVEIVTKRVDGGAFFRLIAFMLVFVLDLLFIFNLKTGK